MFDVVMPTITVLPPFFVDLIACSIVALFPMNSKSTSAPLSPVNLLIALTASSFLAFTV